ncbi:MAG TPA: Nramp family divalent metal transporter, partial [Chitinophagaceae bacterium]|nr:Nramp family divalent metal transporter [Chitinophagaceae bacterium]
MKDSVDQSLSEVHGSVDTSKKKGWFRKLLAFSGPAYLVSVGYMDPGNWATDLAGGSQFGYQLIWVILMSNLMALLLQSLCARLGIVRGRDLAQANREAYPPFVNFMLYILAELAIAATDLAEVIGMAIGLELLFHMPLWLGITLTALDTFFILALQKVGIRKLEAIILGLIAVIGLSLLWEILLSKPDFGDVAAGFIPSIPNNSALYIAIGIIGATVMPHNLYLHSSLVQSRKVERKHKSIKQALRMNVFDSAMALNIAFFVNAGLLVLAGATFFTSGNTEVAELQDAYKLLEPLLGNNWAPILFAVALIAAGQSSTVTGTLAGQIVMEGYLRLRISPWMRRLITRMAAIIPALLIVLIAGEKSVGELLIFSQVLLSLQLGFAVIPLIHFVSDKKTMGRFVIKWYTKVAAWGITIILIFLNLKLVTGEMKSIFLESNMWTKYLLLIIVVGLVILLLYTFIFPLVGKQRMTKSSRIHKRKFILPDIQHLKHPKYGKIALALDFSQTDEDILSKALAQGYEQTEYVLIHITESASARTLGRESLDYETREDE